MEIFLITFAIFGITIFGMSIGLIFGKTTIKGHCGSPTLLEGCIKDSFGNKVINCAHCDCE